MSSLYWLVSLAAIAGVLLNIHKRVEAFWIWSVTNAVWAVADWTHGLEAQAALMSVYFLLSLWGIWKWTPREKGALHGEDPNGRV